MQKQAPPGYDRAAANLLVERTKQVDGVTNAVFRVDNDDNYWFESEIDRRSGWMDVTDLSDCQSPIPTSPTG